MLIQDNIVYSFLLPPNNMVAQREGTTKKADNRGFHTHVRRSGLVPSPIEQPVNPVNHG